MIEDRPLQFEIELKKLVIRVFQPPWSKHATCNLIGIDAEKREYLFFYKDEEGERQLLDITQLHYERKQNP